MSDKLKTAEAVVPDTVQIPRNDAIQDIEPGVLELLKGFDEVPDESYVQRVVVDVEEGTTVEFLKPTDE